jgi:Tfp pilus assembly protein PilN
MRELEFLPAWYPQARRRKRLVVLQVYMTLLLGGGLAAWMLLVSRNTRAAGASLSDINIQLSQTQSELHQLEEQVTLKNQLLVQRQIVERLGLPVEMSRMLSTLDQKMPPEMSLTDLSFETQEQLKVVSTLAGARSAGRGDNIDRKLRIRLEGVAPTDNDVANFLAGLTNVPFFEQVTMTYSRDRSDNGHVMREFEVTFCLDLNQQTGG